MQNVLLILVDGMRPDSLELCGHPFYREMLKHSIYTLNAQTVMPSVTLPCHFSLFLSVPADRHGILTNTYVPQVRPVNGLCEVLRAAEKQLTFFYSWEELRDLSRPNNLSYSVFISGRNNGYDVATPKLTEHYLNMKKTMSPDFTFFYLGWPDAAGHGHGWMSYEYIRSVRGCFDEIQRVIEDASDDTLVILTADHGGHNRSHGSDLPEDMTIPLFLYRRDFTPAELPKASILDIAPTITKYLGVKADPEWEGTPLL